MILPDLPLTQPLILRKAPDSAILQLYNVHIWTSPTWSDKPPGVVVVGVPLRRLDGLAVLQSRPRRSDNLRPSFGHLRTVTRRHEGLADQSVTFGRFWWFHNFKSAILLFSWSWKVTKKDLGFFQLRVSFR